MAAVAVKQAYRFALDPSPAQERMLVSHAGAARFAWNWGLARCRDRHDAEGKWYSGAARAISDQGFGIARRMLGYKTTWNGGQPIVAGRWFPSSKTCSGCGAVKTKLGLSVRTYRCDTCGLVLDRDVNAARNLLQLAASGAESLNACGGMVRPSLSGQVPVNQEPGTAQAGKTGTAARQQAAAA
jgi:putative transposase